jgi:hypothetical protein
MRFIRLSGLPGTPAAYTEIIDAIWDGQEKSAASIRKYIQPDEYPGCV